MNCMDVEKGIELYVLGGTDALNGREIGQHLRACPNCRRSQRECEDVLSTLQTLLKMQRVGGAHRAYAPNTGSPALRANSRREDYGITIVDVFGSHSCRASGFGRYVRGSQ